MLRHKKNVHRGVEEKGTDVSGTESELSDTETTESVTDNGMSEADEVSDTDSHASADHYDPWESVIQRAFEKCQDQFEEKVTKQIQTLPIGETEARERVYQEMRSTYRKAVGAIFTERMEWFYGVRKHPVYKAIKRTATNFMDIDDYSPDEAWKSAVGQRKYLFDNILAEYNPPELEGDELEEEDAHSLYSDEPQAKKIKVL